MSKCRGANQPGVPPYVAFQKSRSHIGYADYLGQQYDPFMGNLAARLPVYDPVGKDTGLTSNAQMFRFALDLNFRRIHQRRKLLRDFDNFRRDLDYTATLESIDRYQQQAVETLIGGRVQSAFDLQREPQRSKSRYGTHLWRQQVLLARRMVEAGVSFVTIDLSYRTASGTWGNHGDNIPP